ncbi:DUF1697 domain-containing protein [Brevundimonas bacteroides]|uniref:DUF1697 domain-containing protein n=1 Tax=Brevundimonas bacteroides TaxID=74311 RepID=UPI00049654A6|nr:DUF1697 domain-containing protein [Brevundimonas bacteroides]
MSEHRIILFRGMNTGGVRAPVAEQRAMAEAMGLENPRTLLASGNLVVESDRDPAVLEADVEAAMQDHFGLKIAAMVRTGRQWSELISANPCPDEARADPSRLQVMVMKDGVRAEGVEAVRAFAVGAERLIETPHALWLWHPDGIGQSKMAEKATQVRLLGMGTARNWNTVMKLADMVGVGR